MLSADERGRLCTWDLTIITKFMCVDNFLYLRTGADSSIMIVILTACGNSPKSAASPPTMSGVWPPAQLLSTAEFDCVGGDATLPWSFATLQQCVGLHASHSVLKTALNLFRYCWHSMVEDRPRYRREHTNWYYIHQRRDNSWCSCQIEPRDSSFLRSNSEVPVPGIQIFPGKCEDSTNSLSWHKKGTQFKEDKWAVGSFLPSTGTPPSTGLL